MRFPNIKSIAPFAAGVLLALAAGWAAFPRVLYHTARQPVNFSHKIHADKAGQKCDDCHSFRADGTFAGVPSLDKCAACHAAPMGSSADEKAFIDQYVTPNREPVWLVNSEQPQNVFFSHATHVKTAGMKCETCHPGQGEGDSLRPYQQDRISGYTRDVWRGMKMDDCVHCHERQGLAHSCLDCHK